MDLLIKVYMPSDDFPLGGKMSQYIENLKIGETLDFTGPKGRLEYKGCGSFKIDGIKKSDPMRESHVTEIGMIAGGSGITPMWQIIQDVFQNCQNDKTKIHLLFANKTEDDILLRSGKTFLDGNNDRFFGLSAIFDRQLLKNIGTVSWYHSKFIFRNRKVIQTVSRSIQSHFLNKSTTRRL